MSGSESFADKLKALAEERERQPADPEPAPPSPSGRGGAGAVAVPDDADYRMWYQLETFEVPVAESEVVPAPADDPSHGFVGDGYVVYTDYDTDYRLWRVDNRSEVHDGVDREYGYWFPETHQFEVVTRD